MDIRMRRLGAEAHRKAYAKYPGTGADYDPRRGVLIDRELARGLAGLPSSSTPAERQKAEDEFWKGVMNNSKY